MSRYLEPPHPQLNLKGKYIRFKYHKQDSCELPCLRVGRIIENDEDDYLIEQVVPEHGIRKIKRQRIICYELLETDNE